MFPAPCFEMLVYGDRKRTEPAWQGLDRLRDAAVRQPGTGAAWIIRHAALVDLFVAASAFGGGVLDAAFAQERVDRAGPVAAGIDAALRELALALSRSWFQGSLPEPASVTAAIERLARLPLPAEIETKQAEGYAHYALYPEAYAVAAQHLRGRSPVVLGLRSIGLGLGAVVAANTQAPLCLSLRPVGHPFRRELSLADDLRAALSARREGVFALVDEGPGLSGSSFAAGAAMLREIGVTSRSIHLFPSHSNPPGGAASPEIAAIWRTAPKHVVGFEALALATPEPRQRLASWVEDLTGPALAPLQDIGAGGWRALRADGARWPAAPHKERRKFLLRSARGAFLLRFAGLGARGRDVLRRAQRLAAGGFAPEPLGLRHGFLVEPWLAGTTLDPAQDRPALIAHLAAYLAFRAGSLPAEPADGATLDALDRMRRQNIAELFGLESAGGLWLPPPPPEGTVRRTQTDNRMQRWEWLRRPDGGIVKTDSVDHCDAHDLVGCQNIAWDAVGAAIEFSLNDREAGELGARLRAAGHALDPRLVAFYESSYLAFQAASFAMDAQVQQQAPDSCALLAECRRYSAALRNVCSGRSRNHLCT
jgi:hypothetical protein